MTHRAEARAQSKFDRGSQRCTQMKSKEDTRTFRLIQSTAKLFALSSHFSKRRDYIFCLASKALYFFFLVDWIVRMTRRLPGRLPFATMR